jgi:nicotinamidase-related amidase
MGTELALNRGSTALIVIDMQNEYSHPQGFYAKARDYLAPLNLDPGLVGQAIPKINELLEAARRAGLYIVHTRMVRDPDLRWVGAVHKIMPSTYTAYKDAPGGPPTTLGSWGAEIIDELRPKAGEYVVTKRLYSAFYQTDLEMILRRAGIRTLIIAGAILHTCVLHTIFDAYCRDFDVIVAEDGVSTWAPDLYRPILRTIDLILGAVRPTREIIAAFEAN